MGKKTGIDYEKMTIEQLASLSNWHRHRYQIWLEGKNKKKEIKNDFSNMLKESCDKYIFYR